MKSISFTATKGDRGYVKAALVPSRKRSEKSEGWGMAIAGTLLLAATAFICLLVLAR